MILLAAGESRRFGGGNKLLCEFKGKLLYRHIFDRLIQIREKRKDVTLCVVTRYEEIQDYAESVQVPVIWNDHSHEGITSSLKLGITCVGDVKENDSYCFFVADQPHLKTDTINRFFDFFLENHYTIGCIGAEGRRGNPSVFHVKYRNELLNLSGDTGGKQLFLRHPEECFIYETDSKIELVDYDETW